MTWYFKFQCLCFHCYCTEMQLIFVCSSCILWPCWSQLLVLGGWFYVCVCVCVFFGILYVDSHAVCKPDHFISSFFNLYVFCFFFCFIARDFNIYLITIIGVIILAVCMKFRNLTSFDVHLPSSVYNIIVINISSTYI